MKIECVQNEKTGLWTVVVFVNVDGQKEVQRLCSGSGPTVPEAAWWAGHHAERMLDSITDGLERFGVQAPSDEDQTKTQLETIRLQKERHDRESTK